MYHFDSEMWLWEGGEAAWHFVTVPEDISDEITERMEGGRRGFGSVRVQATIDPVTWRTSVFPSSSLKAFILPVKKEVRRRAGIEDGDLVSIALELLDD